MANKKEEMSTQILG